MKRAFVFFALFLLLSCTKFGKNVTVKGYVLNPITGQGIEGIEVSLLKGTNGLPGGFKAVKTVYTDANGCYELNKYGWSHYDVRVQAGDRYDIGWFVDGEYQYSSTGLLSVKKRKTMHADYHAVDYGCLQYHIENQNCEGATDSMIYRVKYQYNNFLDLWSFPTIGCFNTTFSGCTVVPMGSHIFEIKVYRPSGITHFYDTVFVNSNLTTQYDLVY